jgi:hypothetical protein
MHNNYSSSKTLHNEDGRHTSLKNKDICVGGFMSYLRYLCIVVFSSCVLYVDSFSGLLAMFDYLFRILSTFIIYFG